MLSPDHDRACVKERVMPTVDHRNCLRYTFPTLSIDLMENWLKGHKNDGFELLVERRKNSDGVVS